jgi:hypothetical protein
VAGEAVSEGGAVSQIAGGVEEATEQVSGAAAQAMGQAMAEGGRMASQVVGRVTASRPRTGAAIVTDVVDAA